VHCVRLEEPGLVREHDRLHAVAEVQLLEDVRDVRLDRGVADIELLGESRSARSWSRSRRSCSTCSRWPQPTACSCSSSSTGSARTWSA